MISKICKTTSAICSSSLIRPKIDPMRLTVSLPTLPRILPKWTLRTVSYFVPKISLQDLRSKGIDVAPGSSKKEWAALLMGLSKATKDQVNLTITFSSFTNPNFDFHFNPTVTSLKDLRESLNKKTPDVLFVNQVSLTPDVIDELAAFMSTLDRAKFKIGVPG